MKKIVMLKTICVLILGLVALPSLATKGRKGSHTTFEAFENTSQRVNRMEVSRDFTINNKVDAMLFFTNVMKHGINRTSKDTNIVMKLGTHYVDALKNWGPAPRSNYIIVTDTIGKVLEDNEALQTVSSSATQNLVVENAVGTAFSMGLVNADMADLGDPESITEKKEEIDEHCQALAAA